MTRKSEAIGVFKIYYYETVFDVFRFTLYCRKPALDIDWMMIGSLTTAAATSHATEPMTNEFIEPHANERSFPVESLDPQHLQTICE